MTIEEAKYILKENMDGWIKSPLVNVDERLIKANNMAIKSLEACEKVKEEIETEIKAYDETVTFHRGIRIGLKIAEEFIDKYLSEVEHDD